MMVGEVFLLSTEAVATYYGHDDELHLAFNFPPLFAPWLADRWAACIDDTRRSLDPRGAWPTWVLSNHDNPRHRTRYDRAAARAGEDPATTARRSEARARAAAVLLLTLRGTPFVYQGDELGLADADIPEDRAVDPGGRDGCRALLPWDAIGRPRVADGRRGHALAAAGARRPTSRNRAAQRGRPGLGPPPLPAGHRRRARRRRRWRSGRSSGSPSPDGTLAYRRRLDGDAVHRAGELHGGRGRRWPCPDWTGRRCSWPSDDPDPVGGFTGVLGPDQAVVLTRLRAMDDGTDGAARAGVPPTGQLRTRSPASSRSRRSHRATSSGRSSWPLRRMQQTSVPIHGPRSMQWTAPQRCHAGCAGRTRSSRSKSSSFQSRRTRCVCGSMAIVRFAPCRRFQWTRAADPTARSVPPFPPILGRPRTHL